MEKWPKFPKFVKKQNINLLIQAQQTPSRINTKSKLRQFVVKLLKFKKSQRKRHYIQEKNDTNATDVSSETVEAKR